MGRRKKWNLDLLSGQTAGLVLLGGMFLVGSAVGCVLAGLLDTAELKSLSDYVEGYMALVSEGALHPSFWPLVWEVVRFPLLAFLLGFTALGIVGLPLLFAGRGFLLCFSVSSFYRLFGFAGEIPAFFLFGLSALLWVPALFHLGVQGLVAAYSLLRRGMGEGRYPLCYDYRYLARCGICAGALAGCVAVEYLAVPAIMQAVAGMI